MPKFNKSYLRNLIAQGETKTAIQDLVAMRPKLRPESLQTEVTHLSARWNDYERALRMGTTSQDQLDLTKRQIDQSLLQLLERIEEVGSSAKTTSSRTAWIALAVVAVILVGIVTLFGSNLKAVLFPEQVAIASIDTIPEQPILVDSTDISKPETIASPKGKPPKEVPPTTKTSTAVPQEEIPKTKAEKTITQKIEPLKISARSNKGKSNLRFQSGETAAFYYEVNQACYVRFIGKLVDGRSVLLFEDQKIGASETNQSLTLAEFTVEPPLGEEQIYFFAQNKAFPTLETYTSEDDYIVITDGLPKALQKTRGFKVKNAFAEDRLDILTYE